MNVFDGRTAIVTGGSRGIGQAIVRELVGCGASVVFSYNSNKAAADGVVADLKESGGRSMAIQADARRVESARELVDAALEHFGGVDFLVNNAGVASPASTVKMTDEAWHNTLDTNLHAAFYLSRLFAQTLLKRKKAGGIVNISSVLGSIGAAGQTSYGASKAALNMFTRSLAREVAPYGIRANAVAPGWIDTDMLDIVPEKQMQEYVSQVPQGRMGRPEEVARVVRFLLSDEASYVNGAVLRIDGGLAA